MPRIAFRLLPFVLLLFLAGAGASFVVAAEAPPGITGAEISILVRTTIVALNQANITGNYTVLRDLSASELQATSTTAQLSDMFRAFRDRNLDLAPTVLLDPKLLRQPELTVDGTLHLAGYFATQPEEVTFDMTFRFESGRWRVLSLNVGTRPRQ